MNGSFPLLRSLSRLPRLLVLLAAGISLAGCSGGSGGDAGSSGRRISVGPVGVSQSVAVNETDDAAIWVHPTDPALSLVLISNERRGLQVHEPSGLLRKHVDDGLRPNAVDLLYDFPTPAGKVDLALATCFEERTPGVKVWRIDPSKRKLLDASSGTVLRAFDGTAPLGLGTYHSRKTGKCYYFVTNAKGKIEQYELIAEANDQVSAKKVRELALSAKTEGCVADDERGVIYFAEEDVGIWRFDAEPDGSAVGKKVISANENGLVPDIEGLAMFFTRDGGYLLAVSQGAVGGRSVVNVYERGGDNAYVLTLDPTELATGAIERASGLAVVSTALPGFPAGMLLVNDHVTRLPTEDMKIYSWADIAKAGKLKTDPGWSPRAGK